MQTAASKENAENFQPNGSNSYPNKLNRPYWQKKRLEIFQRDNWSCTNCKAIDKVLHAHHVDYIDGLQPWEYPNDMLTTLCESCHSKELVRTKQEDYLLQSLKSKGFLASDILRLSTLIDNKFFADRLKEIVRRGNK